jgi:branched-chain amino acid aminotransferase
MPNLNLGNQEHRVAFLDGQIVPEEEAKVSISDYGVRRGDAAFDSWRTFKHRHFKLTDHLDRLYRSARYARIVPQLSRAEMEKVAEEVLDKNRDTLGPDDDLLVVAWLSAGLDPVAAKGTTLISCKPVPFAGFAHYYTTGTRLITPPTRRIPHQAIEPQAKTTTYLNHHIALREAKAFDPGCWGALILDMNGFITETDRSNFLFFSEGQLKVPNRRGYLPGVTMKLVIELCEKMGIKAVEADYVPFDVYNADEAFLTVSSFSILPVLALNAIPIGSGKPGTLYQRLVKAVSDYVGVDIVQQAAAHVPQEHQARRVGT